MIALREVDLLGIFITPALPCLLAAVAICLPMRRLLSRFAIDRYVWNRSLFDLCLLICTTDLLVLSLRYAGP